MVRLYHAPLDRPCAGGRRGARDAGGAAAGWGILFRIEIVDTTLCCVVLDP
jgi:hypothetical protein